VALLVVTDLVDQQFDLCIGVLDRLSIADRKNVFFTAALDRQLERIFVGRSRHANRSIGISLSEAVCRNFFTKLSRACSPIVESPFGIYQAEKLDASPWYPVNLSAPLKSIIEQIECRYPSGCFLRDESGNGATIWLDLSASFSPGACVCEKPFAMRP
jgi:hypothetical protein